MKALTLQQPWASLIQVGAKHIETRSWRTYYTGFLVIHAGGTLRRKMERQLRPQSPFRQALVGQPDPLPAGQFLCACELTHIVRIAGPGDGAQEAAFGDYRPGRFAFHLRNITPLSGPPILAPGFLSLWGVLPAHQHRIVDALAGTVLEELARQAILAARGGVL